VLVSKIEYQDVIRWTLPVANHMTFLPTKAVLAEPIFDRNMASRLMLELTRLWQSWIRTTGSQWMRALAAVDLNPQQQTTSPSQVLGGHTDGG